VPAGNGKCFLTLSFSYVLLDKKQKEEAAAEERKN
jgi:hypothetical protein